jgi:hypothetical protein
MHKNIYKASIMDTKSILHFSNFMRNLQQIKVLRQDQVEVNANLAAGPPGTKPMNVNPGVFSFP